MIFVAVVTGALLIKQTKVAVIASPPANHPIQQATLLIGHPNEIPRRAEGFVGEKMEPLSLVMIGSSNDVIAMFNRRSWTKADLPTPIRVIKERLAALTMGIRRRHHTRLWQTTYCAMPGCRTIWVATASFDVGIELSAQLHLPTHRIDPHIDEERALIIYDLSRAGATELGTIAVVTPLRGTNAPGDAFMTDGRAVILAAPQS